MIIDLVEDLQTNLKIWQQRDINYFNGNKFIRNYKKLKVNYIDKTHKFNGWYYDIFYIYKLYKIGDIKNCERLLNLHKKYKVIFKIQKLIENIEFKKIDCDYEYESNDDFNEISCFDLSDHDVEFEERNDELNCRQFRILNKLKKEEPKGFEYGKIVSNDKNIYKYDKRFIYDFTEIDKNYKQLEEYEQLEEYDSEYTDIEDIGDYEDYEVYNKNSDNEDSENENSDNENED